jgi:hypothetical protein
MLCTSLYFYFLDKIKWKYSINVLSSFSNCTGGVMVSVLASSVVDRVFESRSGQIKDNKIGICGNSAKHTVHVGLNAF